MNLMHQSYSQVHLFKSENKGFFPKKEFFLKIHLNKKLIDTIIHKNPIILCNFLCGKNHT